MTVMKSIFMSSFAHKVSVNLKYCRCMLYSPTSSQIQMYFFLELIESLYYTQNDHIICWKLLRTLYWGTDQASASSRCFISSSSERSTAFTVLLQYCFLWIYNIIFQCKILQPLHRVVVPLSKDSKSGGWLPSSWRNSFNSTLKIWASDLQTLFIGRSSFSW